MDKLLGVLNLSTLGVRTTKDDDFVDRMNHRYTTFIMVIFAVVVTTRQYVGDPINCWAPAHFTSNYVEYTNKICWVSNTYYVPFHVINIPESREPVERINYYQWVPMILLVQALFFHVPHAIWQSLNTRTGLDIPGIIDSGFMLQHVNVEQDRTRVMRYLSSQLDMYLVSTREFNKSCCKFMRTFLAKNACFVCGRRYGNYLLSLYLWVKFLYVVNSVGQLFLLNAFLRTDFHVYGLEVISKVIHSPDADYSYSERFPRVTMCDFRIRQLANTHRHTVQCVLPINLFNEKIFIFIWFWLVFMAVMSALNFLVWTFRVICLRNQVYFVKRHLRHMFTEQQDRDDIKKLGKSFVMDYLRHDGLLVLRLMELNTNHLVTAELIASLWQQFKYNRPPLTKRGSEASLMVEV